MILPQLPREPIRPELEGNEADKELWQPSWRCFCCHDTGLIRGWLIDLVIPGYNSYRDKPIVCQNFRCEAGVASRGDLNYDQRFTSVICVELDKRSREDWKHTVLSQHELIQNRIKDTAKDISFRKCVRTCVEQAEAQRRHEEIISAVPGQLRAMANTYLGGEWMDSL